MQRLSNRPSRRQVDLTYDLLHEAVLGAGVPIQVVFDDVSDAELQVLVDADEPTSPRERAPGRWTFVVGWSVRDAGEEQEPAAAIWSLDGTSGAFRLARTSVGWTQTQHAMTKFLRAAWDSLAGAEPQEVDAASIARASEVLVHKLYVLLEEKGELERALATALGDLSLAQARIVQLEAALQLAQVELTRAKRPSRPILGGVAAIVLSLVAGGAGGAAQEGVARYLAPTADAAVQVIEVCARVDEREANQGKKVASGRSEADLEQDPPAAQR